MLEFLQINMKLYLSFQIIACTEGVGCEYAPVDCDDNGKLAVCFPRGAH